MTIANFNFVKDVCYLGASELTNSFKDKKPRVLHKFISTEETIYPILSKIPNIKNNNPTIIENVTPFTITGPAT